MKNQLLLFLLLSIAIPVFSQQNATQTLLLAKQAKRLQVDKKGITPNNFFQLYSEELGSSDRDSWRKKRVFQGDKGWQRTKFQQYHQGIPVVGAIYTLHEQQGRILKASGQVAPFISLSKQAGIGPSQASQAAENALYNQLITEGELGGEKHISWTTSKASLCIIDPKFPQVSGKYNLAYEVLVEAEYKHPIKYKVYVDAHTGVMIGHFNEIISHSVEGEAETHYYGKQKIITESVNPSLFQLRDYTRGRGVITLNRNSNIAEDFTDEDNYWESSDDHEFKVATDAHYCTTSYFDFMLDNFNWEGVDGQGQELIAVVNERGRFYTNAFWNGTEAHFGNGDCDRYGPLTTMDIVGHEFTHGFTQLTSGLIYKDESGALNEALSDIFGKALEYNYDREHFNWLIGDRIKIDPDVNVIRSMEDPYLRFDPKYYGGRYWSTGSGDFGGVHTNSGVLNYWFYLLVEGKTGVNEKNTPFSVASIGMEKALQIAFEMQIGYLTPNATYVDALYASLDAAADLFGLNSVEYANVLEAWRTVGLWPGIEDLDLSIKIVESDFLICPGEQEKVSVIIRNVGKITYPTDAALVIIYRESKLDEEFIDLQLDQALLPGDSLLYEFDKPLTASDNSYPLRITLVADDNLLANNQEVVFIRTSNLNGIDVELLGFDFDLTSKCTDFDIARFRYRLRINGCEAVEVGDTLFFDIKTDRGDQTLFRVQPYNLLPGFLTWSSIPFQEENFPENFSIYSATLRLAKDQVTSNNFAEGTLNQVTGIGNGYFENFSNGSISPYFELTTNDNYVKDTLIYFRENPMLAFAGVREQISFRNCPEPEDFFDMHSSIAATISYCVDTEGMVRPTLGFSTMHWINEQLEEIVDKNHQVMIRVQIDSADFEFPIVYGQATYDFIEHEFHLPVGYSGLLEIKLLTLSGKDSALINHDFSDIDALLIDNIRLYDKVRDPQEYNEEGFVVYPNPTTQFVSVKSKDTNTLYDILVYDNLGRLVFRKKEIRNQYWFDLSKHAPGFYYLSILQAGKIISTSTVVKSD